MVEPFEANTLYRNFVNNFIHYLETEHETMFLIFQFTCYFVMSELKIIRDKMEMWLTE